MTDDRVVHDLPSPDMPGHVQPSPATPFTLTVEEAIARYAQLGHPRNPRSIRRFCQQGTIDCRKVRTSNFSELYLIDPVSIERHVKEITETFPVVPPDMAAHDLPSPDKGGHDRPRPDTIVHSVHDARYVALLEKVNVDQAEQLKTKDEQLKIKDSQIASMLERDRETNFVIRGMQTLLGLPEGQGSTSAHTIPKDKPPHEQPLSPEL
jgi:hypothetical protein